MFRETALEAGVEGLGRLASALFKSKESKRYATSVGFKLAALLVGIDDDGVDEDGL